MTIMSKTKEDEWWTTPTDAEDTGRLVMVTGRKDVDEARNNPRFKFRIDVTWQYEPADAPNGPGTGMPTPEQAEVMEQATEALQQTFRRDPSAGIMTGIYTGDGRRDWVFYVASLHIFQRKLNEALASLPAMPLTFHAEEDPDWQEYSEMRAATELSAPSDDE